MNGKSDTRNDFDLKATCTLDDLVNMAVIQRKSAESFRKDGNTGMAEQSDFNEMLMVQMMMVLFNVRPGDILAEIDKRTQ